MAIIDGTSGDDTLEGTSGTDTINGLGGNDRIDGGQGGGQDTINGGEGNDNLVAWGSFSVLNGGSGNDTLTATGIPQTLDGGDGDDVINADLDAQAGTSFIGGAGSDTIVAYINDFTLASFSGIENIRGAIGTAESVGLTASQLDGFSGRIEGAFSIKTAGSVNFAGNTLNIETLFLNDAGNNVNFTGATGQIGTLFGGSGADTIVGGTSNVWAGSGDDLVTGLAQDDTISGDLGNDTLNGGDGNDHLIGSHGRDELYGGGGADRFTAYHPSDLAAGDICDGGAGNDTFYYSGTNADFSDVVFTDIEDFRYAYNLKYPDEVDAAMTAAQLDAFTGTIISGSITLTTGGSVDFSGNTLGIYQLNLSAEGTVVDLTGALSGTAIGIAGGAGADIITLGVGAFVYGGGGDDVLNASAGGNSMNGADDDDLLNGGAGNDRLTGENGDDTIYGAAGIDVIEGSAGVDRMFGQDGDDVFSIASPDELGIGEIYDGGEGVDTISYRGNYRFSPTDFSAVTFAGIEHFYCYYSVFAPGLGDVAMTAAQLDSITSRLSARSFTLTTGGTVDLRENQIDFYDLILSNAGNQIDFSGSTVSLPAVNRVFGGVGNDTIILDAAGLVKGGAGDDAVTGGAFNDTLEGGVGDDLLTGGKGDDQLNGDAGADTMTGGLGNDLFYVDDAGDVVTELAGEGRDMVYAEISYSLSDNVEGLRLRGAADLDGFGNGLANEITGTDGANALVGQGGNDTLGGGGGNDILEGGAGADFMSGGTGDDTYYVDSRADQVSEREDGGYDRVYSEVNFTLAAHVEELTLVGPLAIKGDGNALDNYMDGNDAANQLNGGLGADTLIGGRGNDLYIVDNLGDTIFEVAGQGADMVYASVSYVLFSGFAGQIENMRLRGTTDIDGSGNGLANEITGNDGANTLNGMDGNDTLGGGDGNDTLDGGAGADFMAGATGDDTYYVDNRADQIREREGGGYDRVFAAANATLSAFVEELTLVGPLAIKGDGNALDNLMTGSDADNQLNGKAGADTMIGGLGNDLYYVESLGDRVTELAGEGRDMVYSAISYFLADNVEGLRLQGTGNLNGDGNNLDNEITGTDGANALRGWGGNDTLGGGDGDDTLDGGWGADVMSGGLGNDTYYVNDAADYVRETASNSFDTVFASVSSYVLGENLDALVLQGTLAVRQDGTGNELNNIIVGTDGQNYLRGMGGLDILDGGGGRDTLDGGIANEEDALRYLEVSHSTGVDRDLIVNLHLDGEDRFFFPRLPRPEILDNAVTVGTLSEASFDADLAAAIGAAQMRADSVVLFDPNAGDLNQAGHVYLIVDANGIAGYQARADYVFEIVNATGTLTLDDFV